MDKAKPGYAIISDDAVIRQGDRVMAHPATDAWMRGDRYGVVENIGSKYVWVRMDVSGRVIKFSPGHLASIPMA